MYLIDQLLFTLLGRKLLKVGSSSILGYPFPEYLHTNSSSYAT